MKYTALADLSQLICMTCRFATFLTTSEPFKRIFLSIVVSLFKRD